MLASLPCSCTSHRVGGSVISLWSAETQGRLIPLSHPFQKHQALNSETVVELIIQKSFFLEKGKAAGSTEWKNSVLDTTLLSEFCRGPRVKMEAQANSSLIGAEMFLVKLKSLSPLPK